MKGLSRTSLNMLRRHNIRFSSTIDLRATTAKTMSPQLVHGIREFNELFRLDPGLRHREICNWDLVALEQPDHFSALPDEQTHLHLQLLFDDSGTLIFNNLVHPQVQGYLQTQASLVYRFLQAHLAYRSISLHLGFAVEETSRDPNDNHSVPKSTVLSMEEVRSRILSSLGVFRDQVRQIGYQGPLLIETLDYQEDTAETGETSSAYTYITEPAFVREIVEQTGYGLLLDPAHLLISAMNMGYSDPLVYLEELLQGINLDLVQEIHLSVPEKTPDRWLDNHRPFGDNKETELMLGLFRRIIEKKLPSQEPLIINFESPLETVAADALRTVGVIDSILTRLDI